jgi:hypothetical protein
MKKYFKILWSLLFKHNNELTDYYKLNPNFIYAYQDNDGGIYKTMSLSLMGNCDAPAYIFAEHQTYYGFVRIDNKCGYCQHMFHTLEELFIHQKNTTHKDYKIYLFSNQEDFFVWCLTRKKQYI